MASTSDRCFVRFLFFVPVQFDAKSKHSIVVPGQLELPMALHGVISHLFTCKPTSDKLLNRYHIGLLQSVDLTTNMPWKPNSLKFAETEAAAHIAASVTALRATIPLTIASAQTPEEEEEDRFSSGSNIQRPNVLDDRQIAVTSRWNRADSVIELIDDDEVVTRTVSAINIGSHSRQRHSLVQGGSCTLSIDGSGLDYCASPTKYTVISEETSVHKCLPMGQSTTCSIR